MRINRYWQDYRYEGTIEAKDFTLQYTLDYRIEFEKESENVCLYLDTDSCRVEYTYIYDDGKEVTGVESNGTDAYGMVEHDHERFIEYAKDQYDDESNYDYATGH